MADEQNPPLRPCGSLQLLSPASFHLAHSRLLSPFILSVALLHFCYSTSALVFFSLKRHGVFIFYRTPHLHFGFFIGLSYYLQSRNVLTKYQFSLFIVVRIEKIDRGGQMYTFVQASPQNLKQALNSTCVVLRCYNPKVLPVLRSNQYTLINGSLPFFLILEPIV